MPPVTRNDIRAAVLREQRIYLQLLADAEHEFEAAKHELKRPAENLADGKLHDMEYIANVTDAYIQAERQLRYYQQLPDMFKAYKMGIELPDNKFEDNDVENGVLTKEAALWLKDAIKSKRRSTVEYYAKIVVPILALLVAAIGVYFNLIKRSP